MDKYTAFAELLKDQATADQILSDSIEQTQQNLKERGLDFSIEELEKIAAQAIAQAEQDELSEEDLEDVAGGVTPVVAALICVIIVVGIFRIKQWIKARR